MYVCMFVCIYLCVCVCVHNIDVTTLASWFQKTSSSLMTNADHPMMQLSSGSGASVMVICRSFAKRFRSPSIACILPDILKSQRPIVFPP